MKKVLLSVLVMSSFVLSTAHARPASGTTVPVIVSSVSPSGATALVTSDIRDGSGKVVITQGSHVQTHVEYVPARRLGRPAEATVKLLSVTANNGVSVPLMGEVVLKGRSRTGMAAGLTAGTLLIYGPLNFLHLLHRGGDLPSGHSVHSTATVQ